MNYYNEFDPKAAVWLRALIDHKLIPDGHIDTRSISDVTPADLRGYAQCHFFAGIGGWPLALSMAGWPADRPVWTGSCPCQPFSDAGKGAGEADPRHLWPTWFGLIRQCFPREILGEQVASKAALAWYDGVSADLEGAFYATGAFDLCSAGVGAPNIRQRLYWAARDTAVCVSAGGGESQRDSGESRGHAIESREGNGAPVTGSHAESGRSGNVHGATGNVQHAEGDGRGERGTESSGRGVAARCGDDGPTSRLAEPHSRQCDGLADGEGCERNGPQAGRIESDGQSAAGGESERMAEPNGRNAGDRDEQRGGEQRQFSQDSGAGDSLVHAEFAGLEGHAGNGDHGDESGRVGADSAGSVATAGRADFWSDFELIYCRDAKVRRIEPRLEPLAYGIPGRVALLRGFGNAINPEIAAEFIRAYLEATA